MFSMRNCHYMFILFCYVVIISEMSQWNDRKDWIPLNRSISAHYILTKYTSYPNPSLLTDSATNWPRNVCFSILMYFVIDSHQTNLPNCTTERFLLCTFIIRIFLWRTTRSYNVTLFMNENHLKVFTFSKLEPTKFTCLK